MIEVEAGKEDLWDRLYENHEKIRSLDGVIDSMLSQIETWQFFVEHDEWIKYINYYRKGEIEKEDIWDDVFICAC